LNRTPPIASTLAPQVTAALSNIIARALEKDPARRYRRVADLRADLERVSQHANSPSPASAIELDASVSDAHAALANVMFLFDWDWTNAGREMERAIELDPNSASAHEMHGNYLAR
jgi:hypothetical protein